MTEINTERLVLQPVGQNVARALLDGQTPHGMVLAAGYPSEFSREVLELAAAADPAVAATGPYFIVRKADREIVGEIGSDIDTASGTAQVGYSIVEPLWGLGYATEALYALITHLLTRVGVRRVVAETFVEHTASRRVMEKAGMRQCGERAGEEDGRTVALAIYETGAGGA